MEAIHEITHGNKVIEITQDESPENPREWNDYLGKMVCFHNRYDLGDKTDLKSEMFNGWEELEQHLIKEEKAIIVLPLFLYDHSGITIKIGSFHGLLSQGHAYFDSGQVGFVYVTKQDLKKEGITKEKAIEILKAEVEEYDSYLRGEVYVFTIYEVKTCNEGHEHKEVIESCGGFYSEKDALAEAEMYFK
jgi:hypothetical protein